VSLEVAGFEERANDLELMVVWVSTTGDKRSFLLLRCGEDAKQIERTDLA